MNQFRKDFSVLDNDVVYLDSAASSLKPNCVVDVINNYNKFIGVNVFRGVYELSYQATNLYEEARESVAKLVNVKSKEIIFTRGASSALNLVCQIHRNWINEGDEIIISELEHHSNFIPWQKLCEERKAKLVFVPLTDDGQITVENFSKVLTDKTKIVSLTHVSNVMGYITPVKEITKLAHQKNARVVIDGAQAVPHMNIDLKDLDCDFYAFSGHKMCGPTGIGVLYGKFKLLESLEPVEFGGDMADVVTKESTTYKSSPFKYETGTPLIAGAIGLGEACKYLNKVGLENIKNHEKHLTELCVKELKKIDGVEIYNEKAKNGIVAFNISNVHPHDAATVYDQYKVCLRAGYHCAQPIMNFLKQNSTLRISFYLYNNEEDVKRFISATKEVVEYFRKF